MQLSYDRSFMYVYERVLFVSVDRWDHVNSIFLTTFCFLWVATQTCISFHFIYTFYRCVCINCALRIVFWDLSFIFFFQGCCHHSFNGGIRLSFATTCRCNRCILYQLLLKNWWLIIDSSHSNPIDVPYKTVWVLDMFVLSHVDFIYLAEDYLVFFVVVLYCGRMWLTLLF